MMGKIKSREGRELCMRGDLVASEDASRVKHVFGGRCRNHHRGRSQPRAEAALHCQDLGSSSYHDVNWGLKSKQHFSRCFPLVFSLGISQCNDFICVL